MVMQLLPGQTLSAARDALSGEENWHILQQLMEILEFIHAKGWIHRDIKPGNVMYDGHTVTELDFEICVFAEATDEDRLMSGVGTEGYRAPEAWSRVYR